MKAPAWARMLLGFLAPPEEVDGVLGDLEEAHRLNLRDRRWARATLRTAFETLDMAFALLITRFGRSGTLRRGQGLRARSPRVSWLDFKLGFRMLLKYPGLTVVAGIAIAFAIAVGSGTFEFASDLIFPTMPFDQGDRIVEIRNRNVITGETDPRALHDFTLWRGEAHSVVEMGAFRSFRRNLLIDEVHAKPVAGVEINAAAFGIPRVPPLLGRPLAESDESAGNPEVAVIGYELWQSVFGGDQEVIGKTIRLGDAHATVVGVMPEGFAYPAAHAIWIPLRLGVADYAVGEGPGIAVVARLAPATSLQEAQAEFSAIGLRTASDFPRSHGNLRPSVLQFGRVPAFASNWLGRGFYFGIFVCFSALMLLVCANVALLLFARTAAREGEITVRTSLGATRARIVTQLFAEALVLALVSAGVGLWAAHLGLTWVLALFKNMGEGAVGFWFDASLSHSTVTAALLLTVLAGGVAGVVPALRVTGKGIQPSLKRTGAGRGGASFGRLWTVVIVTQIAVTVAFIPVVILIGFQTAEIRGAEMGFQADEYLSARLVRDSGSSEATEETGTEPAGIGEGEDPFQELKIRLADEPRVNGVAMTSNVPGANHPLRRIIVDGPSAVSESARGYRVATGSVDSDFFDALRVPILSGRGFRTADEETGQNVAVVNEDFVRFVLGDRNAIGRRFAYLDPDRDPEDEPGPWYEIIGVVRQVAMQIDPDLASGAGIYHPLVPGGASQVNMIMRVGPDPASFSPRLHKVASETDPTLLLYDIRPMDEGAWMTEMTYASWFWAILAAGGIGLLLSLAGIYSIMAFTVSRRTREIGVRVALGADGRRVVAAIFSRALTQVALGVLVGGVLFLALVFAGSAGTFRPGAKEVLVMVAYLAGMLGVCLLACMVPTRRALAIEPTEALKAEG